MFCPTVVNSNSYYKIWISQKKQTSLLTQNRTWLKCLTRRTRESFSSWFGSGIFKSESVVAIRRPVHRKQGKTCWDVTVQELKEGGQFLERALTGRLSIRTGALEAWKQDREGENTVLLSPRPQCVEVPTPEGYLDAGSFLQWSQMLLFIRVCSIPLSDLPVPLQQGWQERVCPCVWLGYVNSRARQRPVPRCLPGLTESRPHSHFFCYVGRGLKNRSRGWESNTAPSNTALRVVWSRTQDQVSEPVLQGCKGKEKSTVSTGCKGTDFYCVPWFGFFSFLVCLGFF